MALITSDFGPHPHQVMATAVSSRPVAVGRPVPTAAQPAAVSSSWFVRQNMDCPLACWLWFTSDCASNQPAAVAAAPNGPPRPVERLSVSPAVPAAAERPKPRLQVLYVANIDSRQWQWLQSPHQGRGCRAVRLFM